jgi:hypothetical protein
MLGRQIRVFRVIFGTITSGLATDVALKLRQGDSFNPMNMIGIGIVWMVLCLWFISTYGIEHWDEKQKTIIAERDKAQENRLNTISEVRKYTLEKWLPNANTDAEKITILNALGKFMGIANTADLKEDFAIVHTSIADSLGVFLADFKLMESAVYKSMTKIMSKEKKREPENINEDELFPDELLKKQLGG